MTFIPSSSSSNDNEDNTSCGVCNGVVPVDTLNVTFNVDARDSCPCGDYSHSSSAVLTFGGLDVDSLVWTGSTSDSGTVGSCGGFDNLQITLRAHCAMQCDTAGGIGSAFLTVCAFSGASFVQCVNLQSSSFDCATGGSFSCTDTSCCANCDGGSATVS